MKNLKFSNLFLVSLCSLMGANSWAETPIFLVTPNLIPQTQLIAGQQGTAIFQITNNSNRTLNNIGLVGLQTGIANVANAGYQYCTFPLNLIANSYCLIKLNIDSNQISGGMQGGPKVCFSASHPYYCSQPLLADQLATTVTPGPIRPSCNANIANFTAELSQITDSTIIDPPTINSWGPARNHLLLSTANPNLSVCTTTTISNTTNIAWMQNRILAAEDFWVKQKINYCHHHVTDFATPATSYGAPRASIGTSDGGYCSNASDIMPGSTYYGQNVRWNYSGTASETSNNWLNNQYMWYGVDCSDFTSYVYNFAFGIQFNSDTGYQAGQATDGSQDLLMPNGQTTAPGGTLQAYSNSNPNSPAGVLLCKNGQTEIENPRCGGYGTNGYLSSFIDTDYTHGYANRLLPYLSVLHPWDLLFLAFPPSDARRDGNNKTSVVTHVITWTGKQVGYGANDVNPSQIAPESICPQSAWQPTMGAWVIIDSHYQGPDYRVFSTCFYGNNIWGVKRIIGYMS